MDPSSPDSPSEGRRRSTFSSSQYSSATSSSSPEFTTDAVITPDSEEEAGPDVAPSVVPKIEELDGDALDDIDEAKPITADNVILPTPRKRGRPRKHPLVEQKKANHARSKTGCGTCRR